MANKPQKATIKVDPKFITTLSAYLLKNGSVKIIGLGIFKLKRMKAIKKAFNPFTGQHDSFPAYTKMTFTPTFQLKERIQQWR